MCWRSHRFSALQRAEIAEILTLTPCIRYQDEVSVLFNEPKLLKFKIIFDRETRDYGFSALQRAEIAEIEVGAQARAPVAPVSVLFNEPKLLKSRPPLPSSPVF